MVTKPPALLAQPTIRPGQRGAIAPDTPKPPAAATTLVTTTAEQPSDGIPQTLTVYSTMQKNDAGLDTLVGEFIECGQNHGRSFFRRLTEDNGGDAAPVFLYYWDLRDGVDFNGWWFGNKVGGTQVWSRCERTDSTPPPSGWRVPWDGQVHPNLAVEPSKIEATIAAKLEEAKEEVFDTAAAVQIELDERTQRATDQVVISEIEATQALESVNGLLEGEVSEDNLKTIEEVLMAQFSSMTETYKFLAADIMDARRSAPKAVMALNNLTPRVRSVQASLALAMKGAKEVYVKRKQEAQEEREQIRIEEAMMKAEQRDAQALEEALPEAMERVTTAEDTLDMVMAAARPLAEGLADAMSEPVVAAIRETEAAVARSREAIENARTKIAAEVKAAKAFAPEAKKVALTEYGTLQDRLNEAQRRLAQYLHVRKDREQKLESERVISEVASKLGTVEVEVEKVVSMLVGMYPSEEEIKSAESLLPPAATSLEMVIKLLDQKIKGATGTLKDDFTQMQNRANESKKKIDAFRVQLKSQLVQLEVQAMLRQALGKTSAAEEALAQTVEAETPFLKGIEVAPGAEAAAAVNALKRAAKAAEIKTYSARAYLKARLAETGRFPEASKESIVDELSQLQSRVEVVAQKLGAFKRETSARETSILLREVAQQVEEAETRVQKTLKVSAPLAADKLEEMSVAKIREAAEQTLEAEKLAAIACVDAKKMLAAKQKEGQARSSPGYAAELVKLQDRLGLVQQELIKQRKVVVQGEKLWKRTMILLDKEEQMKQVELDVDKAELLTTPLGDECPSDRSIMDMDKTVNAVQKTLTEIVQSIGLEQQNAQGTLKSQLVKLLARARKSQVRVDEMKATTREQRERVQCLVALEEARRKVEQVDVAFMKVAEAEVPYLKGIELLPLEESTKAVSDSEAAAAAVQQRISEARAFIASKSLEVKGLLELVAQPAGVELQALAQRMDEAREKLAQFVNETEGRRRVATEQQATALVAEAEDTVQRTILAAAPLLQSSDEIEQEAAQEIVEKLGETEHEAHDKLEEARSFLLETQRERKAKMDPAALSRLVSRLNGVQVDLAKAKAAASEHEQRFVAEMVLQEANEMVRGFEAELEATTKAAAPLTVEGGKSFVVASMARMILEALSEHCQNSGQSREELFVQISPGAAQGKVNDVEFLAFLEKVPELCARPDLAFSSEQRVAVFEHMDADKDNMVSKTDFLELFRDRLICSREVTITDGFDPARSKTIDTLLVEEVVETLGEQRSLDAMGLVRAEIRVLKDGTSGWVTLQSTQGSAYFSPFTAYTAFIKKLDRTISSTRSTSAKTSAFISSKSAELRECTKGALADAKAELAKIRPRVNLLRAKLGELYKKVEEGKREHSKREELERRNQEEKKDRKAASLILAAVFERLERIEAVLQQLERAAAPITSVNTTDLGSVARPLSLRRAAVEAAEGLCRVVLDARGCLKTHEGRVVKAAKGPWHEAKQEMLKAKQRVEEVEKRGTGLLLSVRAACDSIAASKLAQASAALRSSIQARGISIDALYMELASDDRERVSEAAFGSHLDSLGGVSLTAEQKQLVLEKCGSGGIGRRAFFVMLERYYRCLKEIAITTGFDIKTSNTVRKLEPEEFVEVIEGPQTDESLGVMRIRARALTDGKTGWITAKGNQGTPFLEECSKPCYVSSQAMVIQDSFTTEGCRKIRTLKPCEVLEVMEGPQKEVLGNAIRAYGKATLDGSVGWFTIRNKQGEDCVLPGRSTYTCKQSVALTNDMKIKDCSVLRKLDKGEALVVLEGPAEDETSGVTRVKAKAVKDDMEGWVTTKGNAGSVYVEESGRTYVVTTRMPLQNSFQSDTAADVRMLEEQETVEVQGGVQGGTREERSDAPIRVKVHAVADGTVGWITLRREIMKRWSPTYTCVSPVLLTDVLVVPRAEKVRTLEPGEVLELLEGPKEDASDGALRLRGRTGQDGEVGWATIRGADGEVFLECSVAD